MQHKVRNGTVTLEVESFGRPGDPAVLLVMGATASMLGWPESLCTSLAGPGFHVLRFDHRDTGRSTALPPGEADYCAEDLATDILAVLDGLGIGRAHLVGMSLGGFLSQMVALDHPERVETLTIIAAEPLGWDGATLPGIPAGFLQHFGQLPGLDWSDRAAVTAFLVEIERMSAGSVSRYDPALAKERVTRVMDRAVSLPSMFNHATMGVARDWTGQFRNIAVPTLVIHGAEDRLMPPDNGRALAEGIAEAKLVVIEEMGHELPAFALSRIAEALVRHFGAGR